MTQYDLLDRNVPSPLYLSPNSSTDSVTTAPTEYTLDEDRATYGKADLARANGPESLEGEERYDAIETSGEDQENKSFVPQESDRIKPFLASYEYLTGPTRLRDVPSTQALAGRKFVQDPLWSRVFTPVTRHASEEDSRDLLNFYDEVIRPRMARRDRQMFEDEAWKRVVEPDFPLTFQSGDKVSSLLTSRARWSLDVTRARMRSWVESQIEQRFPDRNPNFDYKQCLDESEYGWNIGVSSSRRWDRNHINFEEVERMHEEEWGEWVLGEDLPYIWTNAGGRNLIIIPSIRRASNPSALEG